ncbi:MAG: HDIG domain-containing metalloprotein [Termitinemataceae bacterium]
MLKQIRIGPAVAVAVAFFVLMVFLLSNVGYSKNSNPILREFEAGKRAERDIIAERSFSYIDEDATRLRRQAQERLVPAVFRYSYEATKDMLNSYGRFKALVRNLFANKVSAEAFRLAVQAEHPGTFPRDALDLLYKSPSRERFLEYGESVLKILLDEGIFSVNNVRLDEYNPDIVEVLRKSAIKNERERVPLSRLVTLPVIPGRLQEIAASSSYPSTFVQIAPSLLSPFVTENVFFSQEDTNHRLEETRARLEPVIKRVERGEKVVQKGTIVSWEDINRIKAYYQSQTSMDPFRKAGLVVLLIFTFCMIIYLTSPRIIGRRLEEKEVYFLVCISLFYELSALILSRMITVDYLPLSIMLPTAFFIMLPAVISGNRIAAVLSLSLPLMAFILGFFDDKALVFSLVSGISGAYALRGTEKRMDLLKAGLLVSGAQIVITLGLLFLQSAPFSQYAVTLFWAICNGMLSALLVLGLLPIFEQILNATTSFRLIELSDLNTPLLKRLLITAPGTYSHSLTVANLAEAACREIGANPLLARVGAYYHDIGKMDQPEYFIENQTSYNKHDELAPRLSATVIRSHVKVGVEKARSVGLPQAVIDIIAEHHGNSLISWFYNEALKREDQVNADDFSYPGNPPQSRESAVVMLADTVEAAMRSMKKPNIVKIERFVNELLMGKLEQGQLQEADITFRDLEKIKNAFVRVLAGHYHSRIEYPKIQKEISFEQR